MDEITTRQIIDYWNERAARFETAGQATLLDDNMRLLEIETVREWLEPGDRALELFCGNGVSTLEYADRCERVVACDLAENMIALARKNLTQRQPRRGNVVFENADVMEIDKRYAGDGFNTVVSIRGLINLPSWELQRDAILKIHALLPEGGKLVFIEGSQEGFETINRMREQLALPPLKEPWYDRHFRVSQLDAFMEPYFAVKSERNLDIYFLVSRVLYPVACRPAEPEFGHLCNTVARLLVPHAQTDAGTTLLICKCFSKKRSG